MKLKLMIRDRSLSIKNRLRFLKCDVWPTLIYGIESWTPKVTMNRLEAFEEVHDDSDGCGAKFTALVVSPKFEGLPLLQRHRLVNSTLAEELPSIHAFSQKTLTPKQWEEQKNKE